MRNFLRTHGKKILAVLGAILMVSFILPNQGNLGNRGSKLLVGYIGDDKVFDVDIRRAKDNWAVLSDFVVFSPQVAGNQIVSVVDPRNPRYSLLGQQMAQNPEVFFLLQQEAARSGVIVLPSEMDEEFNRRQWAVRLQSGAVVGLADVDDPRVQGGVREAAAALVSVERLIDRARMASKVSRPLRQHELARQLQQIKLEVVEFSTAEFLNQVPALSADELKQHFERFADKLPDSPSTAENPHGFGYKFPNRVTLQYIAVRHGDVRKAVLDSKKDKAESWEFLARKYYLRNQARFQETPSPATQPTTASTTLPTTLAAAAPTTGPTTKPFEAVRDEIIEQLTAPEIQRKSRDIQDRINTRMRADYDEWRARNPVAASQPSTQTTTAVATTQPGDYTSFEYLQRLAKDIEQQTGVLPVIASLNQLQTAKDLQSLDGIGQSMLGQVPFGPYATEFALEFVPPADREKSQVLYPHRPSQVMRDLTGSSYVFRVTSAIPSGRPKSIDEVAAAVERNLRFSRAYDIAKERAKATIEAARTSSLASAAQQMNRKSITTGMIDAASPTIEGVTLPTPEAGSRFRMEAVRLLSDAATQPTTPPMRLVELPVQGRVFAAQLLTAKPRIDTVALGMLDAMIEAEIMNDLSEPVMKEWFDYHNVVTRTGYRELTAEQRSEG